MVQSSVFKNLFVPKDQEKEYLLQHNMLFSRLGNGIKVFSAYRNVNDSVSTVINVNFSSGSWFDPEGKKGTHHLLEHLFCPPLRKYQSTNDSHVNAYTSAIETNMVLEGPAHDKHIDFGIWNLLEPVYEHLKNPLSGFEDLEAVISNEKEVIYNEIAHKLSSHDFYLKDFLFHKFYSDKNPLIDLPIGTKDSVSQITQTDLSEVVDKNLTNQGLVVSCGVDFNKETAENLHQKLSDLWIKRPSSGVKSPKINQENLTKLKSKITRKPTYHPTGINNSIVSLVFSWKVNFESFSTERYALMTLIHYLRNEFDRLVRSNGWGYKHDISFYSLGETGGLVHFVIDIKPDSKNELEAFAKIIEKKIKLLFNFKPERLEAIAKLEKKRQEVWPLTIMTCFSWQTYSLKYFDRLIDVNKIIQQRLALKESYLSFWLQRLKTQDPYVTLVGDIDGNRKQTTQF